MLMPRWACRTVVEITEIRVQRVQEIGEDDAIQEGCWITQAITESRLTPIAEFVELWASIHGPDSWDANPWVWAITFRRVELSGPLRGGAS
jgi:hypothetical protein